MSVYEKAREGDNWGVEGGSLRSFNEPALTPMTGRVSDGKLMCLRGKVRKCVCEYVCMQGFFRDFLCVCVCMCMFVYLCVCVYVCVCVFLPYENSLAHQAETFLTSVINMSGCVYT